MTSNSAVDCYDTAQTDVITQNCDEDINRNSNNVSFSCDFAGTTEINNQAETVENDVIKVGPACTTDVSSMAAVTSRDIDAVSDDNDNNIVDTVQLVDKHQEPAVSELSTRDNDVTAAHQPESFDVDMADAAVAADGDDAVVIAKFDDETMETENINEPALIANDARHDDDTADDDAGV